MTDEQLAEQIHEDKVDLLVDLSGHSADNRLLTFARKPAPVQVAWLGYPATSGLKSMDYILADPVTLPPEEEHFYSEKPWHLPETYVCFTQPDFDLPVTELPALRNGYITFGSCNNPLKLNDEVVCCWSDILHAVPDSRLLLNYRTMAKEWSREICRDRFRKCGIAADRLRFASGSTRVEYLATYGQIDIGLDPFPYGGMTTTCEALWMGVPTVTLRMARGMYAHSGELVMKSIGLNDWVTGSVEEYRERVVALAGNPGWLAPLRRSLRAALLASPLCDAERFARNLEEAFHGMVRLSAHVTK
jgi:predicted O-linked N-acetylglucosamine transferase (SPINDLY family)